MFLVDTPSIPMYRETDAAAVQPLHPQLPGSPLYPQQLQPKLPPQGVYCSSTYSTFHQQQVGHQPIYHPLIPMQEALLARGPNFAIVSKYPPGKLTSQQWMRQVPDLPSRRQMSLGQNQATYSRKTALHPNPTSH